MGVYMNASQHLGFSLAVGQALNEVLDRWFLHMEPADRRALTDMMVGHITERGEWK